MELIECQETSQRRTAVTVALAVLLAALLAGLGAAADSHFAPTLTLTADLMSLPPDVAGVTLLAYGNGAPDLSSATAAIAARAPNLALGALSGAGLFVLCVVLAAVIVVAPPVRAMPASVAEDGSARAIFDLAASQPTPGLRGVQVERVVFLRDCLFYLIGATFTVFTIGSRGEVGPSFGWILLAFYVAYVGATVARWQLARRAARRSSFVAAQPPSVDSINDALASDQELDGSDRLALSSVVDPDSLITPTPQDHPSLAPLDLALTPGGLEPTTDRPPLVRTTSASQLASPRWHNRSVIGTVAGAAIAAHHSSESRLPSSISPAIVRALHRRGLHLDVDHHEVLVGSDFRVNQAGQWVRRDSPPKSSRRTRARTIGTPASATFDGQVPRWRSGRNTSSDEDDDDDDDDDDEFGDDYDCDDEADSIRVHEAEGVPGVYLLRPAKRARWQTRLHNLLEVEELGLLGRVVFALLLPLHLAFLLTIPHVAEDTWIKYLAAGTPTFGALALLTLFDLWGTRIGSLVALPAVILPLAFLATLAILLFTRSRRPPSWRHVLVLYAFVGSIVWIYILANEVVSLLQTFGIVFNISEAILGMTVLAWGNSLGDLVADMSVSRAGFPEMGVTATLAGPGFNMIFGLGLGFTIYFATSTSGASYPVGLSGIAILAFGFLLASLVLLLLIVPARSFRLERPVAYLLLSLYATFSFLGILDEVHIFNVPTLPPTM